MSPDPVAPAARDAIIAAYYPGALEEAQAARTRAQSAYTIASAVAAAIVAAGIFGDIDKQQEWVKLLGLVTLAAWLISAGLFINAIAGSVTPAVVGDQPDVDAFAAAAMQNASNERSTVISRQGRAYDCTIVSILLTFGLIVAVIFVDPVSATKERGTFTLTPAAAATVAHACSSFDTTLTGSYDADKLGGAFVAVTADQGECENGRTVAVRLPRPAIQTITATS